MNAYELAKYLEDDFQIQEAVIDMLREQADRIAELEKDLHMVQRHYDQLNTQTKPLSDEEIERIAEKHLKAFAQFIGAGEVCYEGEIEFARAIEERHGIK